MEALEAIHKPREKWTEGKIRALAATVDGRYALRNASVSAYAAAHRIPGLINDLFAPKIVKWTEAAIRARAKAFDSRVAFESGAKGAHNAAKAMGILDDIFPLTVTFWDLEKVLSAIRECPTRNELMKRFSAAYQYARTHNLLDTHYPDSITTNWTEESVRAAAGECNSKAAFRTAYAGANDYATRHGLLDDLFENLRIPEHTEGSARAAAVDYETKSSFAANDRGAYKAALRMGIINDLGFKPGKSGYDSTKPGYIYVADIRLADSNEGVIFGITNKIPGKRYSHRDKSFMWGRTAYLFLDGTSALALETELKRRFVDKRITSKQSPLSAKLGTSGEIVTGVQRSTVELALLEINSKFDGVAAW